MNDLLARIEQHIIKEYGKRSIEKLENLENLEAISTGSIRLDLALKTPFPRGVHMVYGAQGAGKTTMALEILSEAQQADKKIACLYENMERAINPSIVNTIEKLEKNGILIVNPDSAEQCADIAEQTLRSLKGGERACIVIDSVAAMIPESLIAETTGKSEMGRGAGIINAMMRKLCHSAWDTNSVVLLINQTRQNLSPYGPKVRVPGGEALHFYCTQVVSISLGSKEPYGQRKDKDGRMFGRIIKATIQKNRWTLPAMDVPIPLYFGKGIDRAYEIAELLIELALAEKSGTWINVSKSDEWEEIKMQGLDNLADAIRNDKVLEKKFKTKILSLYK
jgi:recombination protein RecA